MAESTPTALNALHQALAEKLLHGWAQNRQQVLVPLTLNLARLEPARRGPVIAMMQAALAARGAAEGAEARLAAALRRAGGDPATPPAEPPDLFRLLAEVEAAGLGGEAYAAASLVLDRRVAGERAFLEWLAARLGLPASLTAGLARRYRR
jgi:uncharacterized membrane protein YebE (DUF533 family)